MSFVELFRKEYYRKLLSPHGSNPIRNRADPFLKVFELLEDRKLSGQDYFHIVETGTSRLDHGYMCFGDDGCATHIFDKFVNFYDGEVLSVDIKQENCDFSNSITSPKTRVTCSDSVKFLWSLPENYKIDFLYLDSYDIERENPHPSQLHHVKELCAAMKNLKKDTIIVVDDHDGFFTGGKIGKGTYVKQFMSDIDAELLFEGYQIGWILGEGK
tara:strand:- start:2451 stop:3092 length:642 start_codon:yes stop_codon:yes gene_type:complete